jgi:hypothetical protein
MDGLTDLAGLGFACGRDNRMRWPAQGNYSATEKVILGAARSRGASIFIDL